jgi:uncharacterized protein (DUF58 family)
LTARPHVLDPSQLSALRDLELLARTTIEGLRHGLHRSPFHGYSAEFSQYRHYRQGDDLKYVDWKAFGRTDRLYSRQFRETTNLGALFVIDVSRSMAFPPDRQSKFQLAQAIMAALATLIIDQGDAAGLLAIADDTPRDVHYVPPRSGPHHLRVCLAELTRLSANGVQPVTTALTRAGTLLRRRGMVVVVSDLYEEDATIAEIRRLSRMGHDVITMHVMSRDEITLPRSDVVEFVDLESGATLVTSPGMIADEYDKEVQAFLSRLERTIEREGLDYVRLITDEPLEPALRRFLIQRQRGGM